jgi:hypothetical protein
MKPWLKWRSDTAALVLIILLFLSHLPFLTSDPDSAISFSRGPFTDEGLNTIQVRNLINHGYLDLDECDNLLKTPLFGATVGIPMYLFGTSLLVARLTVLLLIALILAFLAKDGVFSKLLLFLIPIMFFKYQVFHFSHFSLAEMLATVSVILGIYFLYKTYKPFQREKWHIRNAILAAACISAAYFFKIQFIYIILLPIVTGVERYFMAKNINKRLLLVNGLVMTGMIILLLLIYLIAWYLPSKDTYEYMMAHQSGVFSLGPKTWEYVRFNITFFMFSEGNILFSITFLGYLLAGIIMLYVKPSAHYPVIFKASVIWFLLELHKLTMVYLPTRYQVSLYAAMGVLIAIVMSELLITIATKKKDWAVSSLRAGIITWVVILFILNALDYSESYKSRRYQVREANHYLANTLENDDMTVGAWAPSLTWNARCISIPVWSGFLNDIDPLERLQPRIVVSEPDEQDSEQAYLKQGIDLSTESDSVKSFIIGSWEVNVYWMK